MFCFHFYCQGRPRKGEEPVKILTSRPKPEAVILEPIRDTNMAVTGTLRRSTRKRKRMEFFDVRESDKSDEVKDRKTRGFSAARSSRKIRISSDKLSNENTARTKGDMTGNVKHERKFSSVKPERKAEHRNELVRSNNISCNGRNESGAEEEEEKRKISLDVGKTIIFKNMNGSAKVEPEDEDEGEEGDVDDDSLSENEEHDVDEAVINEASKHIFSCTYCEFAAIDLMELRSHYNENHPNDILMCQPCNQYFLSLKVSLCLSLCYI